MKREIGCWLLLGLAGALCGVLLGYPVPSPDVFLQGLWWLLGGISATTEGWSWLARVIEGWLEED